MSGDKNKTELFQWNLGWFGAQLGGSIWLLLVGIGAFPTKPMLGTVLIGCFFLPNIVGTMLWNLRKKIEVLSGLKYLLLSLFVATAIALVAADLSGDLGLLDQRIQNPRKMYFFLLLFPAMYIWLRYIARNRLQRERGGSAS